MPFKRSTQLFDQFEAALRASGWGCFPLTPPRVHPARYHLTHDALDFSATVYIWTTTPGGKNRPADEWRIQPTNVVGQQFQPEPAPGRTVILGWWKPAGIFTGYDYAFHTAPFGESSSFQVRRHALDAAAADGMAVFSRGNGELAVLFRPELMGAYLSQMLALHASGVAPAEVALIEQIASDPQAVPNEQIGTDVAQPRQHAMAVIKRAIRDARFRNRVLAAYGHRCAFCGVQLHLLEGAHILPVEHPGSTDAVTNGFAACPLHHRAYDRGLIMFDIAYDVKVSAIKVAALEAADRIGGLDAFRNGLLPSILVPANPEDRPAPAYIQAGNAFRDW
jgi:putative restriction endonuclease